MVFSDNVPHLLHVRESSIRVTRQRSLLGQIQTEDVNHYS